jgi:hypothetical protein
MALVLVFLALVLLFYSVSQRQMGSVLRIETVRARQRALDEGCTQAVGRALDLLETGFPPANPYVGGVTLQTSAGPRSFTVTLREEDAGRTRWSVRAVPSGPLDAPPPMPPRFIPPSSP